MDPDVARPVAIVTGATSGIGWWTARGLLEGGWAVVVVGRDADRLRSTEERLRSLVPSAELEVESADLLVRAELEGLGRRLTDRYPRIGLLVNNAGAVFNRRRTTSEGLERTFALNVFAPFVLTRSLLEGLRSAAPARVVMVSSEAHRGARLDLDDLQSERTFSGFRAYSRSKLALNLLTRAFARRLDPARVTVNGVHPGFVSTRFGRDNGGVFGNGLRLAEIAFGRRAQSGARAPLYVATSPELRGVSGAYFRRLRRTEPSSASSDDAASERLWNVLGEIAGARPEAPASPA
ncbi:MAG TPA: SDR family NAD(P)-dependent oxidoreductase [Thermoplasmata archaeon]|nr:SDR family NAD(P)-dependent oxidoreductase [Thermoplasmata archaeon]